MQDRDIMEPYLKAMDEVVFMTGYRDAALRLKPFYDANPDLAVELPELLKQRLDLQQGLYDKMVSLLQCGSRGARSENASRELYAAALKVKILMLLEECDNVEKMLAISDALKGGLEQLTSPKS